MHIFDAQIAAIAAATPSIHALRLRIPDATFRFLPGQWVDLSIEIDGETHTAGYSITTSPIHQGEIELAIKASARHPVAREAAGRSSPFRASHFVWFTTPYVWRMFLRMRLRRTRPTPPHPARR